MGKTTLDRLVALEPKLLAVNEAEAEPTRWRTLMNEIATTPAATFEGVAVKLRVLVHHHENASTTDYNGDLLRTSLEGVNRLAGGAFAGEPAAGTDPDRELLDLSVELAAAEEDTKRPGYTKEQTDAAYSRLIDARARIVDIPAQTIVGLAIKLRVVQVFVDSRAVLPKPEDDPSQHEFDEWAMAKAVWDAERMATMAGGAVAGKAVTVATALPATTIDPLIALEDEYRVADAAFNKAAAAHDDADRAWLKTPRPKRGTPEFEMAYAEAGLAALNQVQDAAHKHAFSIVKKIIATPAVSIEGVAVKLRHAVYWMELGSEGPELELIPSSLKDAERLAGKAPPHASDAELVALYERWRALIDEHAVLAGVPVAEESDTLNHKRERLISEADKIGGQILALPATTNRGLAMKLKVILDAAGYLVTTPPADLPWNERAVAAGLRGVVADLTRDLVPEAGARLKDSDLLALVAAFWEAYREKQSTWEAWQTRRAEVEAMPDCPQGGEGWLAFMEEKGATQLSVIANAANRRSGEAVNAMFATPAQTVQGAIEKVKIARLVTNTDEPHVDLEDFQDSESAWIDNAIGDLERLAGGRGTIATDPLVTLWARWRQAYLATSPADLPAEESDRHGEKLTRRTGAIEDQLMKEPARTMIGIFAQLSVMREWIDWGLNDSMEATIKAFHNGVDSTLRDAAAKLGFDVPAYISTEDMPIPGA